MVILLAFATFISTLIGGLTALRQKGSLHRLLGYTAGVIMAVVAFDLLPEIFHVLSENHMSTTGPMVALMVGFLLFHMTFLTD
jgi:zinc transporter ZupT